jgi:hypothetical protein
VSQRVYGEVLPKVEEERLQRAQAEEGNEPTEVKIDDEFLSCVKKRRVKFEWLLDGSAQLADDRYSDHLAYHSLPRADVMDKVLRYEGRVQKQLDWALQKLLEYQQRRKVHLSARGGDYSSTPPITQNEANK